MGGEDSAAVRGRMLPGIAGVCLYLMFMTMVNVYGGLQGAFGGGVARYGILTLCTLVAVGIFGLLRLRKWGWALVMAGCLLLSFGDFFFFTKTKAFFFVVRGMFALVFFLYLSRAEVRERLVSPVRILCRDAVRSLKTRGLAGRRYPCGRVRA